MKQIFSILSLTMIALQLTGQCMISDLIAEPHACNDNGQFLVDVDFNYVDVTDSFEVRGNGTSYGFFAYSSMPVTIGPLEGDCFTEYEIIVIDRSLPDCNSVYGLGVICCGVPDCFIADLVTEVQCQGDEIFSVSINFEYEAVTDSFEVRGNGNLYGTFAYIDLPIVIEGLAADCSTEYEIVIVDAEQEDCGVDSEMGIVCCDDECSITEMVVEYVCNEDNESFDIWIDADYEGVSDSFEVRGNEIVYGTFAYNELPVTVVNLESNCDIDFEFIIADLSNDDCIAVVGTGPICCDECGFGAFIVEPTNCSDVSQYFIDVSLPDIEIESFIININGEEYSDFVAGDLPIVIGPLEGDCETIYLLEFISSDSTICVQSYLQEAICCPVDCSLSEMEVEYDCNEDNETYDIWINAEYEGVSDSFEIRGNGNLYGTFAYGELPVTLINLEANCDLDLEFIIVDQGDEECNTFVELGPICCEAECAINEMVFEYGCNEDNETFDIWINAEYEGVSDSFEIRGNGNLYGTFAYGELPVTLVNLEANCDLDFEFVIVDQIEEECNTFVEVGPICCEADCAINEMEVEFDCNEDNETFDIWINAAYEGVSDSFEIRGNGNLYGTFAYGELPVTLFNLKANCDLDFEFVIIDQGEEECNTFVDVGPICCEECTIDITAITQLECDNGTVSMLINFEGQNIVEPGILVYINSDLVQEGGPETNAAEIAGYESEDAMLLIEICQAEDELTCCDSLSVQNPCFMDATSDESLGEVFWESNLNSGRLTNATIGFIEFEILTYDGIVIQDGIIRSNDNSHFDFNQMTSGLYLVRVWNNSSQRLIKMIVP